MPNPCSFDSESDFVSACIEERRGEYPDEDPDQSAAVCYSMWKQRDCDKMHQQRSIPEGPVSKAGETLSVGDREAIFIASTSAPDRHGDIVQQNWDFKDFRKNPVLLFQHDSSALPIGKVQKLWTDGPKTYARVQGTPEGLDATADKVWRFIKTGFLSAVSVGFLPLEKPEERLDDKGRWLGWIFPKNSLLELSVVSVPANSEALAVARSMNLTDEDVSTIFEEPKGVSARVRSARRFAEVERLRVR